MRIELKKQNLIPLGQEECAQVNGGMKATPFRVFRATEAKLGESSSLDCRGLTPKPVTPALTPQQAAAIQSMKADMTPNISRVTRILNSPNCGVPQLTPQAKK